VPTFNYTVVFNIQTWHNKTFDTYAKNGLKPASRTGDL